MLLQTVMNEILQSEMTEHLGAESGEQTEDRRGYRNGSYQRKLTTRVGTIELEVPRDRDGTFQTELFERYQRSEKALVTTLMQIGCAGRFHTQSQENYYRALRSGIQSADSEQLNSAARRAGSGLG